MMRKDGRISHEWHCRSHELYAVPRHAPLSQCALSSERRPYRTLAKRHHPMWVAHAKRILGPQTPPGPCWVDRRSVRR